MAARRSRIQIKPNIGGKSSSKQGPKSDEKSSSIQISVEAALGAANAIPDVKGRQSHDEGRQLQKDPQNLQSNISEGKSLGNLTEVSQVNRNVNSNQSFTRLKRFGLSLSSPILQKANELSTKTHKSPLAIPDNKKSPDKVDVLNEKSPGQSAKSPPAGPNSLSQKSPVVAKTFTRKFSSNVPKSSVKSLVSPVTSPTSLTIPFKEKSKEALVLSPDLLKSKLTSSVSREKTTGNESTTKSLNKKTLPLRGPNINSVEKSTSSSKVQSTSSQEKSTLSPIVQNTSPLERTSTLTKTGPTAKKTQPITVTTADPVKASPLKRKTISRDEGQSPAKQNKPQDSELGVANTETTNGKEGVSETSPKPTQDTSSVPSVVQRLPFRSRFPKAKPNINAIKMKSKGLATLTVNREESSSRPSSPLKSPRTLKGASPMKFFQQSQKTVPTTNLEKGQKLGQETSGNTLFVGASEGRKRHISNTSVSTAHSEIQISTKNPPKKGCMTMGDLIHYTPVKKKSDSVTPIKKKAKVEKEKENIETAEPQLPVDEDMDDGPMPVPQVKLAADGSIILNEESVIIKKQDQTPITEVIEESGNTATYNSFRKPLSRIAWSEWETCKFYRALSYLGTDFSLMIKLFPNRTRYDIKTKFKREDKFNRQRVEQALKNKQPFDMSFFENEEQLDREEKERKKKEVEEKVKKAKQLRLEKKKEKVTKETVELSQGDEEPSPSRRETRPRTKRINYADMDRDEPSESADNSSLQTPVQTPKKRHESGPFVPPFCLPQDDDSDSEHLEEQVNMSDTEILSPQRPQRSQVIEEPITINPSDFPPNTNIQITHDANNSPIVLVYHTTEDGKGDTVVHVYQLQNQQNGNIQLGSLGITQDGVTNEEAFHIQEHSDQPMEDSVVSGDGLSFIASSENSSEGQDLEQCQQNHENNEFINVIDINASKISTPKKGQSATDTDQSVYQIVRVDPQTENDTDLSGTSESVAVDNEFLPVTIDKKDSGKKPSSVRKSPRKSQS